MSPRGAWLFLPIGYLITVLIETPVLLIGLSPRHSLRRKLGASVWLNACSYPIVILALPAIFAGSPTWVYIAVAETFAPVCECLLFLAAFYNRAELGLAAMWRDVAAITAANLSSFLIGEVLISFGLFSKFV